MKMYWLTFLVFKSRWIFGRSITTLAPIETLKEIHQRLFK